MTGENKRTFGVAARAFAELADQVRPDQWALPGLGVWDVRSLVGHTSRALSTVETYLGQPGSGAVLTSPVDYFLAVLGGAAGAGAPSRQRAAIAERGREAGAELGDDPARKVRDLAQRVLALVDTSRGDSLLATPAGAMTLASYLPTRTFELTVHSLDLTRALDVAPPPSLAAAISASCELAGALAARRRNAADLLLLLTGRAGLPTGISVL